MRVLANEKAEHEIVFGFFAFYRAIGKMSKPRHVWSCKRWKKQFSVKVGIVVEDSPLGLDKRLLALRLISNAKNGMIHASSYPPRYAAQELREIFWRSRSRRNIYWRQSQEYALRKAQGLK